MSDSTLYRLAEKTGRALEARGLMIATAESCTGGWIAEAITAVPGSSGWFDRGFVTYTNIAKREMLGVLAETLERHGAVSEEVVIEMAEGAQQASHAQVAIAVSGVAGPSGGTPQKPVGTVCFAWSIHTIGTHAETQHFAGDREAVRRQSVVHALSVLVEMLEESTT
jgi:nicotinamide-nucleotide amidase